MIELFHFIDIEKELYQKKYIKSRGLLRTAHISDIHFPVMDSRVQYKILKEQFIDIISQINLDLICINGDLFDHKVLLSSDAAYFASMFIGNLVDICRQKKCTLIILQGTLSHDANQLKLYYHYMQDNTVDVRIITSMQFQYVKNAKILCIPELYGIEESVVQDFVYYGGHYDMAIMHGTFEGAVYKDNAGNSRLFRMCDFDNCRGPIIAGHVHKPDCFQDHFYYCGSPYAWNFADDHEKSFILMTMNLDTRKYYLDRVPIHSFIYRTFSIDQIASNDPKDTIEYITRLKEELNVDYIRIIFNTTISNTNKMIINDYFRTNPNVTLLFNNPEDKLIKQQAEEMESNIKGYEYLLDNKLSNEEKFCRYVNQQKNEMYITVEELSQLLNQVENRK